MDAERLAGSMTSSRIKHEDKNDERQVDEVCDRQNHSSFVHKPDVD